MFLRIETRTSSPLPHPVQSDGSATCPTLQVPYHYCHTVSADVNISVGKSLSRYTGGVHDISSLQAPGRVMFVKARKLKKVS